MIACATVVEICAIRATRLDTTGDVAAGPDNVYIVNDLVQLQITSNIREGDEREMQGGCGGCLIAQKTDDDQFRRFDLELQAGRFEPGLIEILTGGTVIESTDGPLGVLTGAKRACGVPQPRVAFEAWARRWTEDDEYDPVYPYEHLVWPSVSWVEGQNTLGADFSPNALTGKTRANSSWGFGPFGDSPVDVGAFQKGQWATAVVPPTATCDYTTITA